MSYSQADLLAIARALKSQNIDELLAKEAGVESKNEDGPSETNPVPKPTSQPSTSTGPTPAQPDATEKDLSALTGTPRPREGLQAYNILDICSRISFSKDLDQETSTFLPSAHRMYRVLHDLDTLQVQNRYFRQAIPSFLPTHSRIYMGIIFYIQVFRCMDHVNLLSVRDRQFLTTFFLAHPVATLPIPGPLLVIIQSLCVSNPQDARLPRVSPSVPTNLGPNQAQNIYQGPFNFALPNIPMLFGLHQTLTADIVAQAQPNAFTLLNDYGAFGPTAVNKVINGHTYGPGFAAPTTADQAWMTTAPGLGQIIEINDELLTLFKANRNFVRIPTLTGNQAIRDFSEFSRVLQGPWFSILKRNMAVYCRFIKGSGTLQDVKVEGPATGQIVAALSTVNINGPPTGFFQEENLFPGDATYSTTMPANDRIAELNAVYSQVHARVTTHPHGHYNNVGEDSTPNGRNGTFWDVRPVNQPTAPDHVYQSLASELALYVRERADKD
jgi:hypothetical protein